MTDDAAAQFSFSKLKVSETQLDKRSYSPRSRKETDPTFIAWLQDSWDREVANQVTVPNTQAYALYAGLRRAAAELGMGVSIQPPLKNEELRNLRDKGGKGTLDVKFQAKERKQRKPKK